MTRADQTKQQVPAQPTAIVIEGCLWCEARCAQRPAKVIRLDQNRCGIDLSNFPHSQLSGPALIKHCLNKALVVLMMRVPMPVQAAEPCSGERLVYWGVSFYPRVSLSYAACKGGKLLREIWVDQAGVIWTTPMMEQASDRFNPELG